MIDFKIGDKVVPTAEYLSDPCHKECFSEGEVYMVNNIFESSDTVFITTLDGKGIGTFYTFKLKKFDIDIDFWLL